MVIAPLLFEEREELHKGQRENEHNLSGEDLTLTAINHHCEASSTKQSPGCETLCYQSSPRDVFVEAVSGDRRFDNTLVGRTSRAMKLHLTFLPGSLFYRFKGSWLQ